jgi:hypothetical protein
MFVKYKIYHYYLIKMLYLVKVISEVYLVKVISEVYQKSWEQKINGPKQGSQNQLKSHTSEGDAYDVPWF